MSSESRIYPLFFRRRVKREEPPKVSRHPGRLRIKVLLKTPAHTSFAEIRFVVGHLYASKETTLI
jgi:hypothetical protein